LSAKLVPTIADKNIYYIIYIERDREREKKVWGGSERN
jgi:hypothetical protein